MKLSKNRAACAVAQKRKRNLRAILLSSVIVPTAALTGAVAHAQDEGTDADDVIIVQGIRGSLASALNEKRNAPSLIESIKAEDIGKLPDQNLAEVLENITGVQITRQAGVGTGVQIRGTDDNRIEINGVGTVGAGNGIGAGQTRAGVSFEDIDASIIAALEVIKAPTAKTTEGSVGGTVNLRTLRPLDLRGTLASVRIQGEHSNLSKTTTPRFSGALGNKWDTDIGEFGVVLSGSYTRSDVSQFRPRLDRDNPTDCSNGSTTCPAGATHFLGVQFLNQVQINQEYETINIAGSLEYAPNDNLKFYFDGIYNDQERRQESSRVQVSNISRLNGRSDGADGLFANFETFDTFNLGIVPGENGDQDLGSILAVTSGTFRPQQLTDATVDRGAPFIRGSMDSASRLTDTQLYRLGGEWEKGALRATAEVSRVTSNTVSPNLSLTLNFINPNSDRFGTRDENGSPIRFDLRDGITFGFDTASPFAPSVDDLLNPANYVMDNGGTYSANITENAEDTFRLDFSYDLADRGTPFISSVDFGFRHNNRTSLRDNRSASAGGTSTFAESLNGAAVADLLTPIPDNFGDGTGSDLFFQNILHFNPELAADPIQFVDTINAAIANAGISQSPISTTLVSQQSAFFDVTEKANAFYLQANFEHGIFRGNAGVRYVDTDFSSFSNSVDVVTGDLTPVDASSSYDFWLPRVNVAIDATDDIVLRASYTKDINRPDFQFLTAARTFPTRGGVNDVSRVGNPDLRPEEVDSFDVSASWYFAPASVFSVGYFHKTRTSLFGDLIMQPGGPGDPGVVAPDTRDTIGPVCEAGGVFSSNTDAGIFGSGRGVCVGDATRFNAEGSTTQSGIELAFQYSFEDWEDRLGSFGWASGFGVIANYTHQNEDTNTGFINIGESRAQAIYALQGFDPVTNPVSREAATLLNLSEDAYNVTAFYEKYGLTARARYTWRSAYRTNDLPGTSNVFDPLGFRGVAGARGQLNASASYAVTDQFTVSVDAVNLTKSDAPVYCINEDALLCYQGITDRRIVFGASFRY